MTDSPNLALPYIDGGEAQPFVTHNDTVRALEWWLVSPGRADGDVIEVM